MINKEQHFNSRYITRISFISALGGYLFGFDFAVISGALPFLRNVFQLDPVWEGFLTASLALGCMVGCVVAGSVAEKFGRKPGLMLSALIFAVSSLLIAFSNGIFYFISMRFAAGIGVGMASMLCPMYIAEISPAEVRGRNVAINQFTVVIGILVTSIVNFFLADTGKESWRWMFGLGTIPALLFVGGVFLLPESPRWLMKSGRAKEAETVLEKIGDQQFASQTIQAIAKSLAGAKEQTYADVFQKKVRPAVFLGIGLAVFQQFCGSNVLFNYASNIFKSVGSGVSDQLFQTVSIGIVNLLFTVLAMVLVDRIGRRPLMLIGAMGLSLSFAVLGLSLQHHFPVMFVSVLVLTAISTYSLTLAPVTWVLISEIFPNKIRGKASTVAVLSLWAAYFVLIFTFPILADKLGTYGPFYMYAVICFAGFVFVKMKVKETKGQTLEGLEDNLIRH